MNESTFNCFSFRKSKEKCKKSRRCNLCAEHFRPRSHYERYCTSCKEKNDLFRFGNWLPEFDDELMMRFS